MCFGSDFVAKTNELRLENQIWKLIINELNGRFREVTKLCSEDFTVERTSVSSKLSSFIFCQVRRST